MSKKQNIANQKLCELIRNNTHVEDFKKIITQIIKTKQETITSRAEELRDLLLEIEWILYYAHLPEMRDEYKKYWEIDVIDIVLCRVGKEEKNWKRIYYVGNDNPNENDMVDCKRSNIIPGELILIANPKWGIWPAEVGKDSLMYIYNGQIKYEYVGKPRYFCKVDLFGAPQELIKRLKECPITTFGLEKKLHY